MKFSLQIGTEETLVFEMNGAEEIRAIIGEKGLVFFFKEMFELTEVCVSRLKPIAEAIEDCFEVKRCNCTCSKKENETFSK